MFSKIKLLGVKLNWLEMLAYLILFGVLGLTIYVSRDPLEQIDRAEDVSLESAASELIYAYRQYKKDKNNFPWDLADLSGDRLNREGLLASINILISSGYLGPSFKESEELAEIEMYVKSDRPLVCFKPRSQEFSDLAKKKDRFYCFGETNCFYCVN